MRQQKNFYFVIVFLSISFLYPGCKFFEEEENTKIRIQGDVIGIADQTPIVGAKVELWRMSFTNSGGLLEEARSDHLGHYELTYIEEGYCPESLFNIVASANGFISVSYTIFSSISDSTAPQVLCTENLQTINFRLER